MRIITCNLRQRGKREQWLGLESEAPDLLLLHGRAGSAVATSWIRCIRR